jgi:hypothetical protein
MRSRLMLTTLLVGLGLLWATGAWALTPPTPQFGFTGFIQEATLDTAGAICIPKTVDAAGNQVDATLPLVPGTPAARLAGGTITVNGIKMIVPCNTILQMPAATLHLGRPLRPRQLDAGRHVYRRCHGARFPRTRPRLRCRLFPRWGSRWRTVPCPSPRLR